MKLSCLQPNFKAALQGVLRTVPNKSSLFALSCVQLDTVDGQLTITATDLEHYVVRRVGATVQTEGRLLIPASNLAGIVATMPDDRVDLVAGGNDKRDAMLQCGGQKARVRGIDPEEFPNLPTVESTVEMDAGQLQAAISRVAFAAATDDSRPSLAGVLIRGSGGVLRFVAADGFRMAIATVETEANLDVLVPARTLINLGKLLPKEGVVWIGRNENQIVFRANDLELGSRLIEAQFPEWQRILPPEGPTTVTVETSALVGALKAGAAVKPDSGIYRMAATVGESGNILTVRTQSADAGESETTVPVEIAGPEMSWAANGAYLQEIIQAGGYERTHINLTSAATPILIHGGLRESWQAVLMPMSKDR